MTWQSTWSYLSFGCLRHPGASTNGSQLPEEDYSHGCQTGICPTELTVERGREGDGGGGRMQNNTHCKCYAFEGCQHVSVQEHMESWCMHISKTQLTTKGMQALEVTHKSLRALKICCALPPPSKSLAFFLFTQTCSCSCMVCCVFL